MAIRCNNPQDWSVDTAFTPRAVRRNAASSGTIPKEFLRPGVTVEQTIDAQPALARRGGAVPSLDLSVDCSPDERALLAIRHPSGALTFHPSIERARRSAAKTSSVVARFRIPPGRPDVTDGPARRGIISKAIKVIVLKLKEELVDAAISTTVGFVAKGVEGLWWKARGLEEGWFEVDADSLRKRQLRRPRLADLTGNDRALLLIHGTFSHAVGAFGDLAGAPGDFFDTARSIYGNRIFAFNHFTLSRTPEENARMLLQALPNRTISFDVITHSRGGLVLRNLVERRDAFGSLSRRFSLRHGILVASPNAGTPLATAKRWEDTVGFVANILEMFPDNPWTTAAEFVADGIVTLAGHVTQDLPGISSMDANGEGIVELQLPPGPGPNDYSALVANYNPSSAFWQRLLDAGIDSFFVGANDLVVPTEGGWLADASYLSAIPAERIGCFGPGGNLSSVNDGTIHHLNFFSQKGTVDFLLRALRSEAQAIVPINPSASLPTRKLWRSGRGDGARVSTVATRPALAAPAPEVSDKPKVSTPDLIGGDKRSDTQIGRADAFHLMILQANGSDNQSQGNLANEERNRAQILAMYDNARIVEPFKTKNPPKDPEAKKTKSPIMVTRRETDQPGSRFQAIIAVHEQIRQCLDGRPNKKGEVPSLPNEEDLRAFGELLFEALFTGNVRRLYDVARSEPRQGPLNVVLTCTIPWLADKPWEFAFDPSRRKFLVTEEIHFVRNVVTAVPAQYITRCAGPLRMLLVAAQPVGTVELSEEDEAAVVRHSFQTLIDAGLVQVDVLTRATPAALHSYVQGKSYDIVHFIGHGDFDRDAHKGVLLFESADGSMHEVDRRTLREILCGRGIQLVFLNACESGRDAHEELNRGVAQALMEGGMPAVVANQYKVLDPSAVAFAEHFYWSLAQGSSLGEAAREARIAVNYSLSGEVIDWAVPVLYARDPNFRLSDRMQNRAMVQTSPAATRASVRSSVPRKRSGDAASRKTVIRVAVADLARAFPHLQQTLVRLNAVQERFQFSTVDIVAPLGTWQQKSHGHDGKKSYLFANEFARRLVNKPKELGVDYLACITNRPMAYEDKGLKDYDVYGWWDTKELPVILFSTAGLPIPPGGPITDRVIANALALTLTGMLSGTDTHRQGSRTCPMFYNEDRDFSQISGRLEFDSECRKKFRQLLPDDIDALDAMLHAFHQQDAKVAS